MQNNRKAYCEEAQTVIRRQRAAIEKVKEDNLALKRELETTASKACAWRYSTASVEHPGLTLASLAHRRILGRLTF